jgi:hypothetical protein
VQGASSSDEFPLIRSVSEGGNGGAVAAGVWGRGRGNGGHSFAAAAGSSLWEEERESLVRRKSSGTGRSEVKVPTPAVPQAPMGAWGKK